MVLLIGINEPMDIGAKIKLERQNLGWSANRLAREAQVDAPVLHRIESGKAKKPRMETIAKLAKALKLPVDRLLKDVAAARAATDHAEEIGLRFVEQLFEGRPYGQAEKDEAKEQIRNLPPIVPEALQDLYTKHAELAEQVASMLESAAENPQRRDGKRSRPK